MTDSDEEEEPMKFTANSWLQTHILRDDNYVETQKQHEVELFPDTEKEIDPGKNLYLYILYQKLHFNYYLLLIKRFNVLQICI